MKQQLHQIEPNEFDNNELQRAIREGRLYIVQPQLSSDEIKRNSLSEILSYVGAVDDEATEECKSIIRALWQKILNDDLFVNSFLMEKGPNKGKPNKYRVTSMITVMQGLGIYKGESVACIHRKLEKITNKNKYYTNMNQYPISKKQQKFLRFFIGELLRGK